MKTFVGLCFLLFISCYSKKDSGNNQSVGNQHTSGIVKLISFDTSYQTNFILQTENLELGADTISIINYFKPTKDTILDMETYKGTKMVFGKDTLNNFINEIEFLKSSPYYFIPVIDPHGTINPQGREYWHIDKQGKEYIVLTSWFYNCNCSGNYYASKALIIVEKNKANQHSIYLVGINSDKVKLSLLKLTENDGALLMKLKAPPNDLTILIGNKKIALQQYDSRIDYSDLLFQIKNQ